MRDSPSRHVLAVAVSIYASCASSLVARAFGADDVLIATEPRMFFVVLFLFSTFGGLGRLLLLWKPLTLWQHRVGGLILGTFGAWTLALYYWGDVQPTKLMALAGALSAIGGEAIEQVLRVLITRQWPRISSKPIS